jgi:hypothetical protein
MPSPAEVLVNHVKIKFKRLEKSKHFQPDVQVSTISFLVLKYQCIVCKTWYVVTKE